MSTAPSQAEISELGHRKKNLFAVVRAVASQILRPVAERSHVRTLQERLRMLGAAHDILLRKS